jgi:hypothetical protein
MSEPRSDVQLVTLRFYPFLHEALIAREMLEAEGIHALVPDEHTISMDWLYRNAIGGIRLQVRSGDAARANEILDLEAGPVANEAESTGTVAERCAECGGTEFERVDRDRRIAAFTWLALPFPIWWPRRRERCRTCGAVRRG